jgi:hypothetical protein
VASTVSTTPGSQTLEPALALSIFRVNTATGVVLFSGGGVTQTFNFSVATDLSTATLSANIDAFDETSGLMVPFSVNLTLTATAPIIRERGAFHFLGTGFVFNAHFLGDHRDAQATGSVIGDGINYTPIASTSSQIQKNTGGNIQVNVTRPN